MGMKGCEGVAVGRSEGIGAEREREVGGKERMWRPELRDSQPDR